MKKEARRKMAINLNNFVNVNINYRETSSVDSTRDTVVLIKTHSGTSTASAGSEPCMTSIMKETVSR